MSTFKRSVYHLRIYINTHIYIYIYKYINIYTCDRIIIGSAFCILSSDVRQSERSRSDVTKLCRQSAHIVERNFSTIDRM